MTIEDLIKDQIDQLDIKKMVKEEIRRLISDDLKREISKTTKEEIQKIIRVEIEIEMSKPINTDDGWGEKKSYESFGAMFKKFFRKALDDNYGVKRTIEDHVKQQTEKLVKEQTNEIVKALKKSLDACNTIS